MDFKSCSPFEIKSHPLIDKTLSSRLHGSYEALKYGTSLDGLSDLTGGIAENIVLKPQSTDISNILAHLLKLTSIILCKVEAKNADDVSYTVVITLQIF